MFKRDSTEGISATGISERERKVLLAGALQHKTAGETPTMFALTSTYLWINLRGRFQPFIDLGTIVNVHENHKNASKEKKYGAHQHHSQIRRHSLGETEADKSHKNEADDVSGDDVGEQENESEDKEASPQGSPLSPSEGASERHHHHRHVHIPHHQSKSKSDESGSSFSSIVRRRHSEGHAAGGGSILHKLKKKGSIGKVHHHQPKQIKGPNPEKQQEMEFMDELKAMGWNVSAWDEDLRKELMLQLYGKGTSAVVQTLIELEEKQRQRGGGGGDGDSIKDKEGEKGGDKEKGITLEEFEKILKRNEAELKKQQEAESSSRQTEKSGSWLPKFSLPSIIMPSSYSNHSVKRVFHYKFYVLVNPYEYSAEFLKHKFRVRSRSEAEAWIQMLQKYSLSGDAPPPPTSTEDEKDSLESSMVMPPIQPEEVAQKEQEIKLRDQSRAVGTERALSYGQGTSIGRENLAEIRRRAKQELKNRRKQGIAEAKMTVQEMVESKGYPFEQHSITTPDGYILTLWRIPYSKREQTYTKRPVVLLMHGLLDSAITWLLNIESHALGYILANAGYDVWFGNIRGCIFSRQHVSLSPTSVEYWQFNRDHLMIDAKSTIDYVLKTTRRKHLSYIGHSQGTHICFGLMTKHPEYVKKLNIFIALAPAVFVGNHNSRMLTYMSSLKADTIFNVLGMSQFLTASSLANKHGPAFMSHNPRLVRWGTHMALGSLCGWNPDPRNFAMDRLPLLAAHSPAGTSVQVMAHWAQAARTGQFASYDYGKKSKNIEAYGQPIPPEYDFSKLKGAKIAIFYGGADKLTSEKDVNVLLNHLHDAGVAPVYTQFEPEYAHLDFVWGMDAKVKLYEKIVRLVNQYYLETESSDLRRSKDKQKKKKERKELKKQKKKLKQQQLEQGLPIGSELLNDDEDSPTTLTEEDTSTWSSPISSPQTEGSISPLSRAPSASEKLIHQQTDLSQSTKLKSRIKRKDKTKRASLEVPSSSAKQLIEEEERRQAKKAATKKDKKSKQQILEMRNEDGKEEEEDEAEAEAEAAEEEMHRGDEDDGGAEKKHHHHHLHTPLISHIPHPHIRRHSRQED